MKARRRRRFRSISRPRDAAAAKAALSRGGVDICVLDAELADADKASVIKAARAKQPAPLIFVSAPRGSARPDNIDGVLPIPANAGDARKLVEICIRAKMPTRVLIVDDSDAHAQHRAQDPGGQPLRLGHPRGRRTAAPRSTSCATAASAWCFSTTTCRASTAPTSCWGSSAQNPHVAVVMMTSALDKGASGRAAFVGRARLPQKAVLSGRRRRRARALFRPARAELTRRDVSKRSSTAAGVIAAADRARIRRCGCACRALRRKWRRLPRHRW